ncbi:helix-turn-helix transcriptional regulator [Microbispora sp. NBC_01189]|uniref:helix-turn-helix transcriptional regulator n=1 Tax=Microbispora sp. NBC_01189 TaxID=2903583 RepID=UPI002E0DD816
MNAPRSLREVIGERVRDLREAAGKRQEDISRTARSMGLAWSRSKIAALERGEKALSGEELLLLPMLLQWSLDRPVSMSDLFDADGDLQLTSHVRVTARDAPRLLEYDALGNDIVIRPTEQAAQLPGGDPLIWPRIRGRCRELGINGPPAGFAEVLRDSGEAEVRAAYRFKEAPHVFAAISAHLWGRTLTAERDARVRAKEPGDVWDEATANRIYALRGRVTRQLDQEVRVFIANGNAAMRRRLGLDGEE